MKLQDDFKAYLTAYFDEVTGSRLMLVIEFPDGRVKRILIDCGYFQEIRYRYLNYVDDIDPENIDAILITHNHIDHTGLLPKMVKNGYSGSIYTTNITLKLMPKFLLDCCDQQEDNAQYLREKFPQDAYKFDTLYSKNDVKNALKLCKGVDYFQTFDLCPGIKITFLENGHILGASMILVQCIHPGRKPLNFLFTGDYKLTNSFYKVRQVPVWIKNMELILINESTYGTTKSEDIQKCFISNVLAAFENNQNILIAAFAQGRYQEVLLELKLLQMAKMIPPNYVIVVDGSLGISTTESYSDILEKYNPEMADFVPEKIIHADPKNRMGEMGNGVRKIVITTSGMLSNGPARIYLPHVIGREDWMIHVMGYAAEETLARTLLDAKDSETVMIGREEYKKRATVCATREKTSHATLDEMMGFIKEFKKIRFLAINHGGELVKESFMNSVSTYCDNVEDIDILDRNNMYCFIQCSLSDEMYSNIVVKRMPAKLGVTNPKKNKKYKESIREKKSKKKEKVKKDKNKKSTKFKKKKKK